MHYLKLRSLAWAIWRSSLLFLLASISLYSSFGILIYTLVKRSDENLITLGIACLITIFLWITHWFTAENCKCQLCQADIMRSSKCSRHQNAKKLLGSYRRRISFTVVFKGKFQCSFCGEEFQLRAPDIPELTELPPQRRSVSVRKSGVVPAKKR